MTVSSRRHNDVCGLFLPSTGLIENSLFVAFLNFVAELFQCLRIGREGYWKPVQSGVILSTMSILSLQDTHLNQCDYKFVLTARFSQDYLENLFSCVRSKNPVPTLLQFKNNLPILILYAAKFIPTTYIRTGVKTWIR